MSLIWSDSVSKSSSIVEGGPIPLVDVVVLTIEVDVNNVSDRHPHCCEVVVDAAVDVYDDADATLDELMSMSLSSSSSSSLCSTFMSLLPDAVTTS